MAVTIEVVGAKELIAKLTTLQQLKKVQQAILDSGVLVKDALATYPDAGSVDRSPNPNLQGNSAQAKKNRAGFFWHLKNGDIGVPYGRTGNLGARWTVTSADSGWTAVVDNSMKSYNSLVQGPEQTRRHANTGWLTVEKAKEKHGPEVIEKITQALEEELKNV